MKKLLSLVLALSMVLSTFTTVFAGFADVEGTDYTEAVNALVGLGAIKGYEDGTFKPEKTVTRAEMAKMICICLGLESAVQMSAGKTQFSDVSGWASGYVNVAATHNVITGYPDGTFKPNKEVSYNEAITMAVRALGYKTVVEATGTWPYNYSSKANELNILKGIDEDAIGTDGAKRGDVAVLLWNMLNTQMWTVKEENQTNGLSSGKSQEKMLEIKFPNYEVVDETTFVSYSVTYDSKEKENVVKLTFANDLELEYAENDFFMFLEGEKVSLVYDKEDKEVLSVASVEDGEKFAGLVKSFEDEEFYDDLKEEANDNDFVVFYVEDDELTGLGRVVDTADVYVEEVEKEDKYIKITGISGRITKPEKTLVLVDGERKDLTAVEEGVVLTHVDEKFYIVSDETVEGTLTKATSTEWTIDGDKYFATSNTFKYDEDQEKFISYEVDKKAKDQEVRLFISVFGHSVRAEFDELDEEATTNNYYVTNTIVWADTVEGETKHYVKLQNASGVEKYEVNIEEVENYEEVAKYTFVEVTFDKKDVVTAIEVIEEDELFAAKEEDLYLYVGEEMKGEIVSDTQLIKIAYDEEEDTYTVEFEKGTSKFNKFDSDKVACVINNEKDTTEIAYVVVRDNTVTSSDLLFGKVTEIVTDILAENKVKVTVEDEKGNEAEYVYESGACASHINEEDLVEGALIAFVVEEEDDVKYMNIKELATVENVLSESTIKLFDDEMIKSNKKITYNDGEKDVILDLTKKTTWPTGVDFEDYKFVVVEVVDEAIEEDEVITGYDLTEFDSFEVIELADVSLENGDVLGMAKVEEIVIIYKLSNGFVKFTVEGE